MGESWVVHVEGDTEVNLSADMNGVRTMWVHLVGGLSKIDDLSRLP